jgi:serine/threonine protein kinase
VRSLNGVLSAIKVVYLKESELKETWQEVEILKECDHPNIVKLFTTYMQGLYLWVRSLFLLFALQNLFTRITDAA